MILPMSLIGKTPLKWNLWRVKCCRKQVRRLLWRQSTIGENEEYNLYANGLYKAWGIGKKGEDKGVLIFLTVKERKIRIETGYGVEGILPDGLVGEILDKYVVPFLKEGNYGKGSL